MENKGENNFDGNEYMRRLGDLENPLPLDSPLFLPPRPDNNPPETALEKKKGPVKLPTPLSGEEKEKIRNEYLENVKLPASTIFDTFPEDCLTEVVPGKAWVVPGLLSEEECEQIIQAGEEWGITADSKGEPGRGAMRTSKRTSSWVNEEMSMKMIKRLPEELLTAVEATAPYTSVRGIHPNWRVARYQKGETFPAHVDQSDSLVVEHSEKKKQRFTSSHTLLIYLRRRGEQFQGGATRLFLDGRLNTVFTNNSHNWSFAGTYNGVTSDVCLPQGWGLVFQQKGLLHAGLPVEGEGAKYIAQAGLLRGEPNYTAMETAIFKYGPGLAPYRIWKLEGDLCEKWLIHIYHNHGVDRDYYRINSSPFWKFQSCYIQRWSVLKSKCFPA
jgi:hypothetical protein